MNKRKGLILQKQEHFRKFKLPDFTDLNIMIIGDVMLDCYWSGKTKRISPEAPVPIVNIDAQHYRPGGAANVAYSLRYLGCQVNVLGLVGNDASADLLAALLEEVGIEHYFAIDNSAPTIVKNRILSRNQQLLRFDQELPFQQKIADKLDKNFKSFIKDVDLVILSDYGKGTLYNPNKYIKLANKAGLPVCIDPKNEDFNVYKGATVLTPNKHEFYRSIGKYTNQSELEQMASKALDSLQLEALLITQDKSGMTIVSKNEPTMQLSALTKEIYDVTGAGDTVLTIFSVAIASGLSFQQAAYLSNLAASITVGKLGAAPVSLEELKQLLA